MKKLTKDELKYEYQKIYLKYCMGNPKYATSFTALDALTEFMKKFNLTKIEAKDIIK